MGFGAFGQLIATHLAPLFPLVIHDPAAAGINEPPPERVCFATADAVARCDFVILAVPMSEIRSAIRTLRPHLPPKTTIIDVCSVKVRAAEAMLEELPPDIDVVGTHPLFGPQSSRDGIAGRKIAVCPIRGGAPRRIAAFLRRHLGLKVFITTPEQHDREAALVQGVTHLIAKVLVQMEPLPQRLTTASFDRIVEATEMVRYDSPGVFLAIERDNPFAAEVRERFLSLALTARHELEAGNA